MSNNWAYYTIAQLETEIERLRDVVRYWLSFADFLVERKVELPLWGALKFGEACERSRAALEPAAHPETRKP